MDLELDTLKDDDFPDLVGVHETGGLMDEFAFLEDADQVESAARHRQAIGMSPSAITVFTREDIETSGADTIPDLLRLVPGMDVVVASPFWTAITARLIWTYDNSNFLVLIDGREANVEALGQAFWEGLPISLVDCERIEIIRGPGSSLYGANAFAGVISITTRLVPEGTSAAVRLSGGELGNLSASGRVSTRLGNWGLALSAGTDLAGMFSDHRITGKELWTLRSVAEYRWSASRHIRLDASIVKGSGPSHATAGSIYGTSFIRTVQAAYTSEDLRALVYWTNFSINGTISEPLTYMGIHLADFQDLIVHTHTIDADLQWTVPEMLESLLVIIGGGGRVSLAFSDELLDAQTFVDINSPGYHKPGFDHWELRGGAFVHAEYSPVDWATLTGGARLDYNTETSFFISPRLAVVFTPARGHFIRLSAARAFRKPSMMEDKLHPGVTFPEDSPFRGQASQDLFREFMSQTMGGEDLRNEQLVAIEAGYLGKFLDDQLSIALDLYHNSYLDLISMKSSIIMDDLGLPDLQESSFRFRNTGQDRRIIGGELVVRYSPVTSMTLMASWAYREVFYADTGQSTGTSPKNFFTLGGRFRTESGFLGSLYLSSRSEFNEVDVPNPRGIFDPLQHQHFDHVFMVQGRLGWRWTDVRGINLETGFKLFLPVSPFQAPHFGYFEMGGGVTPFGKIYGGEQLSRVVSVYAEGWF